MTDRLGYGAVEDRTLPAVAYALYLLAFATGFTAIVGLIVAYANRSGAGARMRTHYTFLIRTFWLGLLWMGLAALLFALGLPLSLVLIGIPLLFLAKGVFGLACLWYGLRAVVGVIYLARDEPYPRPYAVLL